MRGRVLDVPQGSDAWRQARAGLLTGSVVGEIFATLKSGGEPAGRRDLRLQLACERLTGIPAEDRYVTRDMQRGTAREPDAIAAYEAHTGSIVARVGFVQHRELPTGCSPDALVDEGRGVIEVKCPRSATHLQYLRANCVPAEHRAQVLHACWITGAAWADFVSFDDRFPRPLQLFVVRWVPTADQVAAHELAVVQFLREVETETAAIAALMGVAA